MNISLTPELERLIQRKVESGMYSSASEVIRESLRQTAGSEMKLADLRSALQRGQDDVDAGRYGPLDIEDVKRRGLRAALEPALEAEARGDCAPMDFDSLKADIEREQQ
jgi:antitoxin ParD1/3/4